MGEPDVSGGKAGTLFAACCWFSSPAPISGQTYGCGKGESAYNFPGRSPVAVRVR